MGECETSWPPGYEQDGYNDGAITWYLRPDVTVREAAVGDAGPKFDTAEDARRDAWLDYRKRQGDAMEEAAFGVVGSGAAAHDPVENPSHYTDGGEDFTDGEEARMTADEFRGAMLFNARKYLRRAGKKGDIVEDLKKARWYIDRLIANVEGKKL